MRVATHTASSACFVVLRRWRLRIMASNFVSGELPILPPPSISPNVSRSRNLDDKYLRSLFSTMLGIGFSVPSLHNDAMGTAPFWNCTWIASNFGSRPSCNVQSRLIQSEQSTRQTASAVFVDGTCKSWRSRMMTFAACLYVRLNLEMDIFRYDLM